MPTTPPEPDPTELAAQLLTDPAVRAALDDAATKLASHGVTQQVARVVLLDAISRQARTAATAEVETVRRTGTTWNELAAGLNMTVSGVRHRYDQRTVQQHRASEQRRRQRD
jgi:thioesterase domain-containing protein